MTTKISQLTDGVTANGTDKVPVERGGANKYISPAYIFTYIQALTGNLAATARVGVRKNSTGSTFERRRLNLIEGSNVTLTVADDSGSEEVDITIASSGGGGGYTQGARVYNSTNQSISDSTETGLTFDTEDYDTDTIHSTSSNTGLLTCKTAGKYLVTFNGAFGSHATGYRYAALFLNSSNLVDYDNKMAVNGTVSSLRLSVILNLSVNDTLEVKVYQTSGGSLNLLAVTSSSPFFMMQRIG